MANVYLKDTYKKNVEKKVDLFDKSISRFIFRAMMACVYLSLATALAFALGDKISHVNHDLGKVFYSFAFPIALVMIIYMNAELGTSNMAYVSSGVYNKQISFGKGAQILSVTVIANLVGAIVIGFMLAQTTTFTGLDAEHFMFTTIDAKLAKDASTVFIEAIMANMVVNIAVIMALRSTSDSGRILSIMLIVPIFVFLGLEHVIANFSSFALAFFAGAAEMVPNWSAQAVITNLTFAFAGNFVGGGIMMGLGYSWLNNTDSIYKD